MKKMKIVSIGGDGIGPEVIREGLRVLEHVGSLFDLSFEIINIPGGGKYYLEHGIEWPEESFNTCKKADAILLGAVGYPGARLPDNNIAGANIVLGLRFGLDLFANIRPTKLYKGVKHKISNKFQKVWDYNNVNFTIIRENTEGLYYSPSRGLFSRGGIDEAAIDIRLITNKGSERVIRFAFDYAKLDSKGAPSDGHRLVTAIHKNNVLSGCQLFTRKFYEIAKQYSDIRASDILIDAFTQDLLRNPERYNVCVTTNMLGDICTDLASVLQGGMGMAPSAQINGWNSSSSGLFEPIHGSAPKYIGKMIANPIATILAVSMMLDWLGIKTNTKKCRNAANCIEKSVAKTLDSGKVLTPDLGGHSSTKDVTNEILKNFIFE
jgi:3-isopropylmalate dehydrogenase